MIYFTQSEMEIKIGYAVDAGARLRQHMQYGFVPICSMPGSEDDEESVQKFYDALKIRGKDWFKKDDTILDYCTRLIEKQFAHPDCEVAKELPQLPYSAWGPEFLKDNNAIEPDGQITIFSALPVAERLKVVAAQAQNHSFTDEWYTPEWLIGPVVDMFGAIDTDPATSFAVNLKYIKAKTFYTKHTNGLDLSRPWHGKVFLNPPYGKGESSAGKFIERLCNEFESGNVKQAITCLNQASMTSKWFYSIVPRLVSAHCIINGRPNFIPPQGKTATSPNKGTVFSYFGSETPQFCEIFRPMGQIVIPEGRRNA